MSTLSGKGAGVFVVAVFGLFSKFGKTKSAVASLTIGATVWFLSHYLFKFELSYILALGSAFVSYIIVGLIERSVATLSSPTTPEKTKRLGATSIMWWKGT